MYKFTAFMLQLAAVITFLVSIVPLTAASAVGILFSICVFALGVVMWRRADKGYCEWVPDSDIEGWGWDEEQQDFTRYNWNGEDEE